MKKRINYSRPTTYEEAVQKRDWGAGKRSYNLPEGTDEYLAGTVGQLKLQPEGDTQPEDRLSATINLADIEQLREQPTQTNHHDSS